MSEGNQFPVFVSFRIDDPTAAQLAAVSQAAGVKPNAWARTCLIKALGSSMKAPAVRRAAANAGRLDAMLDELRAHGRNLNQMTRHANSAGSLLSLAADIKAMMMQTETLMARVLDALNVEEDA